MVGIHPQILKILKIVQGNYWFETGRRTEIISGDGLSGTDYFGSELTYLQPRKILLDSTLKLTIRTGKQLPRWRIRMDDI
jgi:hypothetical protein